MKLTVKDYLIIGLLVLFVFSGVFYSSGVKTLKKENKALHTTIKANNKVIDNLSTDISILKTDIAQELIIIEKQKQELKDLKQKNKLIKQKYENILSDYNGLNNDDKWQFFRSTINK